MSERRGFSPAWSEELPGEGTYRSIFKWGGRDVFKHPSDRLWKMLKERFKLGDDHFLKPTQEGRARLECAPPSAFGEQQLRAFRDFVGSDNVETDTFSRAKFSSGKGAEEVMELRAEVVRDIADAVVHPRDKKDVQQIVEYCDAHRIPINIYGGGSGVTCGLKCPKGGIVLVMQTHMNRVLALNDANQTATVEPGILGPDYERALNNAQKTFGAPHRYTGGHFPQSFEYSTVGGWIAALGSGQQSTYYGDMYDLVQSQEYVTPVGTFKTLDYPATATGPKVSDMMKGSEGAFGVLVGATLKIFRLLPENRQRFAFIFPDFQSAVRASREILQQEFGRPSALRISDAEETAVAMKLYGIEGTILDAYMSLRGYKPGARCLMLGCADGEIGFAKHIKKKSSQVARAQKAMSITGYPVKKWEHGRFSDPYLREDLNDYGMIIDTLETGVTWDKLETVHRHVREFVNGTTNAVLMTHASHFYPQGTNLYFIFITPVTSIEAYRGLQQGIIDCIERSGGSLSHHHGVGKMAAPWMERHLGKEQMAVLRALKAHFDPHGIMNPGGTLGLDLANEKRK